MKYQVFADYSFEELNTTINEWLNAVAGLDICHVTQSQIYDPDKGALTTISIFYTETTLGGHHEPVFGGIKSPDIVTL